MTAANGSEVLLGELRGLLSRLDPAPPELFDQVRQLFCWRTVEVELAELSFDSLVDRDGELAVRSAAVAPRMLGFGAVVDGADVAIEVEVDGSVLVGQLWPAEATSIQVQTSGGRSYRVPVDAFGRFQVDPVPTGPVRLCVAHRRREVQTTWVSYASG
jgi:hypothetical protein